MSNSTKNEKEATENDWAIFLNANFISGKEKVKCIKGFILDRSCASQKDWLRVFEVTLTHCINTKSHFHAYTRYKILNGTINEIFQLSEDFVWNNEFYEPIQRIFNSAKRPSKYNSPKKMIEDCINTYDNWSDKQLRNNISVPLEQVRDLISDLDESENRNSPIKVNLNASAFAYFVKSAIDKGWFKAVEDKEGEPNYRATARELLKVFDVKNTTKDENITAANFADLFNPDRNNCSVGVKRFFDIDLLKLDEINFKSPIKQKAKSPNK
jgi:hypothetical protein